MLAPASCPSTLNMNLNVQVSALSQAIPPLLKRKRSDSSITEAPHATRPRTDDGSSTAATPSIAVAAIKSESTPDATLGRAVPASPPSTIAREAVSEPTKPPTTKARPSANLVRDTINAQLSLEVLLKHNELRLIDQEIAKCQVALEQLRRCAEIPYPGSAVSAISADVSAGVGASVLAPGNGPAPISPAPWGVTEGAYSRHYARWLLPDPRFDGGEVDGASGPMRNGSFAVPEGRSTRGNPLDFSSLAGKTRPSRAMPQSKFQSLSAGYPVPKEKPGPMIIRRKSDQVWVKLVCLDCRRDNFSSTQGFINHCRIAHNRNFASHDAAAMASGEPVEVDEAGAVIGTTATSTVASPVTATPRGDSIAGHVPASGLVHPLIRSAQLPIPSAESPSVTPQKSPVNGQPKAQSRHQSRSFKVEKHPSFLASPATPHLSALMSERGHGLDLNKMVQEAKTPVDLSGLFDDDSDPESGNQPTGSQRPCSRDGVAAARQPMRIPTAKATTTSQRPESRKGTTQEEQADSLAATPTRPSYQPSFLDFASLPRGPHPSLVDGACDGDGLVHSANLSPNALESNQAPSLVSDDEDDYEAASDSDSPSSSEADEEEQEFRHIEVEDDERAGAPSTAAAPEPKSGPALADPRSQTTAPIPKPPKHNRKKFTMSSGLGDAKVDDLQPKGDGQHGHADKNNTRPSR
ncbi:Uncharacterized protein PECH_007334 [Penicillium ucsense]|uniref:AHC1-like C2H2 zinc-finger domain-containing protein n=1 Tax=Penicillium ucsense TaxID=2839758 RepID=A0A8J8WEY2_9EURO|nr:Uncharacterized protein PECM_002211 [Penicillium ucsense]KAF7734965.1 Uncharacterized protein PECH_007334 [Penicillium ucsense]